MRRFAAMIARIVIVLACLLPGIVNAQWQRMAAGGMVNDSMALPFNAHCIVGTGSMIYVGGNAMGDKPGFYRSTDGGASWSTPNGTGMGMQEISALTLLSDTIIAGTMGADSTTAALWMSVDRGATWTRLCTVYLDASARPADTMCVVRDLICTPTGCTARTSQGLVVTLQREKGQWKVARSKDVRTQSDGMMDMAGATVVHGDTTVQYRTIRDTDGIVYVEQTTSTMPVARRMKLSTTQQGAYVVCSLFTVINGMAIAALRDLTDLRAPDRIYVSRLDGGMLWTALPVISQIHYGAKAVDAAIIGNNLYVVFDAMGGVWRSALH